MPSRMLEDFLKGGRSFLEAMFTRNAPIEYQKAFLSVFNNDDYDNLRCVNRNLYLQLTQREAGNRRWMNQQYMISQCHEFDLPFRPEGYYDAEFGRCPNNRNRANVVRQCVDCKREWPDIKDLHLVCERCRNTNWNDDYHGTLPRVPARLEWESERGRAWTDVCRTCEGEQRERHPEGLNSCTCIQDRSRAHWTGRVCDDYRRECYHEEVNRREDIYLSQHPVDTDRDADREYEVRLFERPGGRLFPRPSCLCGREPIPNNGHRFLSDPDAVPLRCMMCLGFELSPSRRSKRVRNATNRAKEAPALEQLDFRRSRKGKSTRQINKHGFVV